MHHCSRKGVVLIDNEIAATTTRVVPGQTLTLLTRVQAASHQKSKADVPPLSVAYEDDHIAAVVKPQGMLTVRMGATRDGPALSSCIKHTLTMPQIPGTAPNFVFAFSR